MSTAIATPLATLPPRKRAKTQEEKEQRRIERILRNRRAAHASREKKRRHVELLENHVADMDQVLQLLKLREAQILSVLERSFKECKNRETLETLQNQVAQLPPVPALKMSTLSLLDTNRRSNKKQKATPKPRPIVLKKSDEDLNSSEDEDENDRDEDLDQDEVMDEDDLPQAKKLDNNDSALDLLVETKKSVKRGNKTGAGFAQNDSFDQSGLMAEQELLAPQPLPQQHQAGVYLSPPLSNLDSTSPSLSLELNSNLNEEYYNSHPLFDDLDKESGDFFSTNLQIKHEDDDDTFSLSNLPDTLLFQQRQSDDLNDKSGFKSMHHPAAMMTRKLFFASLFVDTFLSCGKTSKLGLEIQMALVPQSWSKR